MIVFGDGTERLERNKLIFTPSKERTTTKCDREAPNEYNHEDHRLSVEVISIAVWLDYLKITIDANRCEREKTGRKQDDVEKSVKMAESFSIGPLSSDYCIDENG